jgi:NAD(P)H-dependent flavin oxidoreductase YrpB (nitropropane dioxygenase family)
MTDPEAAGARQAADGSPWRRAAAIFERMQMQLPPIIQGGMGVAVSSWPLARAVSLRGQLGVVSGTGIDTVVTRRLQLGDPGGHLRSAFDAFPLRDVAERIWDRYYVAGGKATDAPFKSKPVPTLKMSSALLDLIVISNFAEVFLAKAQHAGLVGINLLEKIQLPNLAALFGAMLAKVDVVLMGAGIPRSIPAVLDRFAAGEPAELKIDVAGALPGEEFHTRFDPRRYLRGAATTLRRPRFLAIVSSSTLALTLARKSSGHVDGFVVEGSSAGGHNAPPRGPMQLDAEQCAAIKPDSTCYEDQRCDIPRDDGCGLVGYDCKDGTWHERMNLCNPPPPRHDVAPPAPSEPAS